MAKSTLPPVKEDYYPMGGGLDLVTPPIALNPGNCFDAQNYEPDTVAGYHRINGFERSDGRPSPTAAVYWYMTITLTGAIAVGNTVTGATSAATAKVLATGTGFLVLGRVSGTFVSGENLTVGGVTQASTTSTANQRGCSDPSNDADYKLLAANDRRADIQTVPGSGSIRGLFIYNDVVYAFRDNVGATAGNLYKQTAGGWSQVTFGSEIQFTNATGQINDGDTITGGTSGATATVVRAMLRGGTWTASGVGTLILSGITGTFQNAEALKVAAVSKATSASANTAITRSPGGSVETVTYNFSGSAATTKVYGADGVNFAFEFDGTNYIPIRTGMAIDSPNHIACHKYHLFLTFLGSLQFSSTGAPYQWTPLTGASEIAMGDTITGLVPQPGSGSTGGALAVFTSKRTAILYGSGSADFNLQNSIYELGFIGGSMQPASNQTYGITARGLQALQTTLGYGDFNYDSISFAVQPLVTSKVALITASVSLKSKNQYRVYFSDNTALVIGLSGPKSAANIYGIPTRDNISGIMPLNYGIPVRRIINATLSTGAEVTYFGSDDGYVYQDNIGTSFDGNPIEAWMRPAFNNMQSPQYRKRFRRAVFEVKTEGYAQVNCSYDTGYASPDAAQSASSSLTLPGAGGYWDQFTWDQFTWDAQVYPSAAISIEGTEKNISFLFYSNRAQDESHSVTGVSISYTARRLERAYS